MIIFSSHFFVFRCAVEVGEGLGREANLRALPHQCISQCFPLERGLVALPLEVMAHSHVLHQTLSANFSSWILRDNRQDIRVVNFLYCPLFAVIVIVHQADHLLIPDVLNALVIQP